ncbi:Frag1/DRAM/Sfk1 [Cokeromyces recurvatus]|uniref:Frag1/DRAM/Sfk1 n=1 Tax=Cokeromyces recurvatus TaxID=90255 RepID=UPI002220C34E|nr:Frag1/DRAM/Sfk1 [Cokeromyces recurvatus]KAI7899011.1 Frag1/DRAM/Sfk1 [Cokeromyces recurvatus]
MSMYNDALVKIPAKYIIYAHTLFAYSAFFIALIIGCYTHYDKIVENEYFGFPQEWFPSVSATIGDRYPARAIFQILIALTSGPRFALIGLNYLYQHTRITKAGLSEILLGIGLIRTVACGGWVYITSTDDHSIHDIAMIIYLLCTLPWQLGVLYTTDAKLYPTALKRRRYLTMAFFGTLPFMIYFYIQHKVNHIPGAYTIYALFEWSLIIYDIAFDATAAFEFKRFEIKVTQKEKKKETIV